MIRMTQQELEQMIEQGLIDPAKLKGYEEAAKTPPLPYYLESKYDNTDQAGFKTEEFYPPHPLDDTLPFPVVALDKKKNKGIGALRLFLIVLLSIVAGISTGWALKYPTVQPATARAHVVNSVQRPTVKAQVIQLNQRLDK